MLDKAVGVLRAVAAAPCALGELCERTGLPRATAHRLAVGLETHRLLARDPDGRWGPGPALAELAGGQRDLLLEAADDVLSRLRDSTGESAQLYRRDGDSRVCVAAAEPASGLRDTVPLGVLLPMDAGSGARVLAAWSSTPSAFDPADLAAVRVRGWAGSTGERAPGVASVSAPVRSPDGDVVAAVSVSGPAERLGRRAGAAWADELFIAARALERRLAPRP